VRLAAALLSANVLLITLVTLWGVLLRWQEKYPRLCAWVEENIEETFTFNRLPREHHKHLKSTNMLERLNQELKRRTRVIRIFPNQESASALDPGAGNRNPRRLGPDPPLPKYGNGFANKENNFNSWRPPKGNELNPAAVSCYLRRTMTLKFSGP
jgi:hypothetical protein